MLTFSFGRFDPTPCVLVLGGSDPTPCALVLGGFDGLHLGHMRLFEEAKKTGRPVAATTMFGGKGKALFTREERREIFEAAGVSLLCEIDLNGPVRAMAAEEFAERIMSLFNVRAVFCGEDFRFGKDALGTPDLLRRRAACPVTVLETVKYLAEDSGRMRKFSATACKRRLKAGDLPGLNACLFTGGKDFRAGAYFVRGAVEHGRQTGRTYGFPTVNLSVPREKLLPPDGVYGGFCATPKGTYPCVLNIGASPTFGVEERRIEAYLDGFSGDLYGETVRIYPTEFYRKIQKFDSPGALERQLERDVERRRERKDR